MIIWWWGNLNEWPLGDTAIHKQHSYLMSLSRYMPIWSFSRNFCFFIEFKTLNSWLIILYEPVMDLQGQAGSWQLLSCCSSGQIFLDHATLFFPKHQASLPYPSQTPHTFMHITHPTSWSQRIQFLRSLTNSHCHIDVKCLQSAWGTYDWPATNKLSIFPASLLVNHKLPYWQLYSTCNLHSSR